MNVQKLKELRHQLGYTQAQVANLLHVSQSVYSTYETEKAEPSAKMLRGIAILFNISADYLLDLPERK